MSGFTTMLQRRYAGQLDERADQYIGFAVDGAVRMQQLINDLLAFSRVGRTTDRFTAVDLDLKLDRALAVLESRRQEAGATIVRETPLPTVLGDSALLEAVFQNLIGNALKFHRPGVAPEIRVACREVGDEWSISVSDDGIGVEPAYAERVFVIFQRLHSKEAYEERGSDWRCAARSSSSTVARSLSNPTTVRERPYASPFPASERSPHG